MLNSAINIVLDENDPTSPVFVEIETDDGVSIRIGERWERSDGLTSIRIKAGDIVSHEKV